MSDASQFYGGTGIRPAGLINGASAFVPIFSVTLSGGLASVVGAKTVASGAVTAATLKTVLSLAGKGAISFLSFQNADTTSRTHRLKVTLDGVVTFDATSIVIGDPRYLFTVIGGLMIFDPTYGYGIIVPEPLIFNNSLLVEYASSLNEANSATLAYRYIPR